MKKIMSALLSFAFFLVTTPSNNAWAGDVLPAGTVLEEESYVFTVDEATRLLQRIDELEQKELQLQEYIQLDIINRQKIELYDANPKIRFFFIDLPRQQLIGIVFLFTKAFKSFY